MTFARLKKALAHGQTSAHWSLVRPNKSLVPDVGLSDLSSPAFSYLYCSILWSSCVRSVVTL